MFTIEALQEFSADPQKEDNPFYQNPDKLQQKDIDELWNELQERSQLDHNSRFVLAVLQSGVQTGTFSPRKNRATVNSDKVLEKMAAVDISQVSEEIFNRIKLPDMTIEAWKRNHINGFDGATREAGSIAEKIIHDLVNHKGSITHDLTTSLEIIKLWLNSKPREEKTKKALENLILILNKLPVNSKHISSICSLITDTEEQPYSDVAEYIARISEYQFLKIGEENRLRSPERGWREQQWLPSDVDFTQETTKGLLDQLGSKFLYKPTQLLKIFQEASDETRTETFVINVLYELTRDSDLDSLPQKPEEYLAALYLLRNIKALKPEFAKPITKTDTIFGYVPDLTQEHFAGKSWYRSAANIFGPLLIDALENQLVAAQEDESSQQRIFADMNAERVESAIYIALTTPSILERLFNKAKTLQWMFKKLSGQTLKQISNTGNYLLQFSLWLYGFERLEKADQDQLRGEVYKALQNKEIVEKLDSEYLEELLEKFTWAERAGILCTLSEETFAKEYVTKHSKGFKKELQKVLGESSVDTQKLSNLGELGLRYNIIDIDTAFRVLTKMSSIASVDMIIQYLELQIKQLGALSPEQQLTQDINIVAILAVLPRSSRSGIATIKEAAIQRLLDYDKSVWEKASISSKEIRSKFIEGLDPRNDDHLKLILKLACFAKKKLIDSLKSQDKFQELLSTALKRTDLVANILEDDLTLFEKAMNALPDLPKRVDVVNDVFYGTLRNPPGNWLEKTERYRDYVRILNSKDLMRCLEGLMRDIGTNSAAITAFIQALYYAKAINLEIAKKILKDESESLTSAKKYILQSFKEYAISCTTAREGYVFYKHVSKLAKIIFADSDLVKQLSEISDAGNNVFSRWSVIKKEEVNGRARVKWQLEFENPTKLGQPYVDVYNASMIQEGISLSDSPLFFESCLKLAGLEVLLKQFGNYDDTVKELVCGYLCTTAFDKAVGNDAILKYICDNNFEISPELSSEQFRQIIE
ncbi:MAG: hypothetical protein JW855_03125, partial [Gammaproteobacteria bacterium]|nr:hypothetical protein [Gammaproteobacteria bacterium]